MLPANPRFRGSVFISYRRADAPGYVRALMTELRTIFGSQQVFLDMEDIEAGSDFSQIIEQAVSTCEVLLAIIGPNWLTTTDEQGQRRIFDPDDYLRLEILSALRRNIPVIPILVENAKMPSEDDMPGELKPLSRLQGVPISHARWDDDIARLFLAIEQVTIEPQLSRRYSGANAKRKNGHWQEALRELEAIESLRPDYLDLAELIKPLRELSLAIARLGPAPQGWRRVAARYPIVSMFIVSLLPNILAAVFNYTYNWTAIVEPMRTRGVNEVEHFFRLAAIIVNTVGFGLGMALFAILAMPAMRKLRERLNGMPVSPEILLIARNRCLLLGHYAALIGVALWIIAGPVYPLLIGAWQLRDYAYFIFTLTVCGVIAASYPFLGVTWLCARVFYLPLVQAGSTTPEDAKGFEHIETLAWRYLLLAGALPMLVITLGLLLNPRTASNMETILLGILGLGGLAGFLLALRLFKSIQGDIALLRQAIRLS